MGKNERLYRVMNVAAGVFICGCYLNYLLVALITNAGAFGATAISLSVFAVVLVPFFLRRHLSRLLGRAYPILKWIYTAGMWVYVLSFTAFCVFIFAYDSSPSGIYHTYSQDEPMTIVTFGCKTNGMTPGKALRRRLNVTLELLEHYPNAVTVVSGGQGTDETNSEAAAMRQYLLDHGIDASRIYTEDQSRNTIENMRYSLALIKQNDLPQTLVGVSHNYHAPRIKLISSRFGVQMRAAGYQMVDLAGMTREFMAYVKLFVFTGKVA